MPLRCVYKRYDKKPRAVSVENRRQLKQVKFGSDKHCGYVSGKLCCRHHKTLRHLPKCSQSGK